MTANEKLAQAKLYLGITGSTQDTLLTSYIADAGYFILAVTKLAVVPAGLEGAQVDIAVANYSRRGAEGESQHSEGGVSVTYESLSPALQSLLRSYSVAKILNMNAPVVIAE